MEASTPHIEPSTFVRVPCSELTLAMIKPDAVAAGHVRDITYAMHSNGFVIVAETQAQFTRVRAEEFYEEYSFKPFYQQLTRFICSGTVHVFILGKEKAIESWKMLMGPTSPETARKDSPSSIRASYGTDVLKNAVHGSYCPQSARREINFFFSNVLLDPLPDATMAQNYFNAHLKTVLVKGLTALAKAKPSSDPLTVLDCDEIVHLRLTLVSILVDGENYKHCVIQTSTLDRNGLQIGCRKTILRNLSLMEGGRTRIFIFIDGRRPHEIFKKRLLCSSVVTCCNIHSDIKADIEPCIQILREEPEDVTLYINFSLGLL